MTSSSSAPKLPLWVFLVIYAALIGAAFYIGANAPRPWSVTAILSVVGCVLVGACIVVIPTIAHYERQKNEMLDDRQRALEALARTIGASAEQISIATGGLNEIAELSQKNLRHAEQLPHKLQEKISEFQAQLANATDTEREELEKELEELRASESERLQSASDKVAKTAAELVKLEASSHQHLAAANEAVAKLAAGTATSIGKAQVAAEQALSHATKEAVRSLGEAASKAVTSIEAAKTAALSDFATQFNGSLERLRDATTLLGATVEKLNVTSKTILLEAAKPGPSPTLGGPAGTDTAPVEPSASSAARSEASPPQGATEAEPQINQANHSAPPPRRTRKPRREDAPAAAAAEAASTPAQQPNAEVSSTEAPPASSAAGADSPIAAPARMEIAQAETSPHTVAGPAPEQAAASESASQVPPQLSSPLEVVGVEPASPMPVEPAKPARKRSPRKEDDTQPGLGLELDEPVGNAGEEPGVVERVLSSDGATRLIVTAYIGIGNRLFIRGKGPGLSWEKGIPLQFVSIGKWRWETNEASTPVEFKLLKNDEQECPALGSLTIDPGHQHEVTANF